MRDKGVYTIDNLPADSLFSVAFAAGSVRTEELRIFRENRLAFIHCHLFTAILYDDSKILKPTSDFRDLTFKIRTENVLLRMNFLHAWYRHLVTRERIRIA